MQRHTAFITALLFAALTSAQTQAGLVLYYDFENDSNVAGDVNDQSGQGNDGTTVNGTFVLDTPGAITGTTSLNFPTGADSSDEWVDADTPGFDGGIFGSVDRTFTAWIKTNKQGDQILVEYGDSSPTGARFTVRLDEAGGVFVPRYEGASTSLNGTVNVADGGWHHIAIVVDESEADNILIYVDGALDIAGSATVNTIDANHDLRIGAGSAASTQDGERVVGGRLDDVALFDMALSPDQIAHLFNGNKTPINVLTQIPSPAALPAGIVLLGMAALGRRRCS